MSKASLPEQQGASVAPQQTPEEQIEHALAQLRQEQADTKADFEARIAALKANFEARIAAFEAQLAKGRLLNGSGELKARLDRTYRKEKPRLAHVLRTMVQQECSRLAVGDNLANSRLDPRDLPHSIAREFAANLTGETHIRGQIAGAQWGNRQYVEDKRHDNSGKLQRLGIELAARAAHTEDLLKSTQLPECPEDPKAFIAKFRHQ